MLPVLLYGCEVWGFSDVTQIEVLHRKFIKILLGVYTTTPNVMVYGESGQFPIINHIIPRMISFFMRLVNGKQSKISFIMYKLMRTMYCLNDNVNAPWIKMIETNLSSMGMRDVWEFHGFNFTSEYVKMAAKLRIRDMFLQKWSDELQSHEYCEVYRSFKNVWKLENYLLDLTYSQRTALCKFRCRSSYIPICNTRFSKECRDDFFCPLCVMNVIADESHLLLHCSFFNEERVKWQHKY